MTTAHEALAGRTFTDAATVARILDCDTRSVRRAIAAGDITVVRVSPGVIRIPVLPFLRNLCGYDDDTLRRLGYLPDHPGLPPPHTAGDAA